MPENDAGKTICRSGKAVENMSRDEWSLFNDSGLIKYPGIPECSQEIALF